MGKVKKTAAPSLEKGMTVKAAKKIKSQLAAKAAKDAKIKAKNPPASKIKAKEPATKTTKTEHAPELYQNLDDGIAAMLEALDNGASFVSLDMKKK
jgi:hypothetical protein